MEKAIDVLRDNSHSEEANELERLANLLGSEDLSIRSDAVNEIEGLCQLRSYGDLAIHSMNGWKWNSLLEKVAKFAKGKCK